MKERRRLLESATKFPTNSSLRASKHGNFCDEENMRKNSNKNGLKSSKKISICSLFFSKNQDKKERESK